MERRVHPRILAFDCSGNGCSAALWSDGKIATHEFEARAVGHAERLVPMLERVLARAGLRFDRLDLLAVTLGPGAFTGVRIGIAAAQGLMLGTGLPCLGLSSLETVAHGVRTTRLAGRALVVALDSRREELFLQGFDAEHQPLGAPALVPVEDWSRKVPAGPLLLAGDGGPRLAARLVGRDLILPEGAGIPDAADLASLAAERWRPGEVAARLEPIYLRAPDVTLPAAPP
jgi:tRNA threonylcarbamoyladenosine biosynthesis protein TsaB